MLRVHFTAADLARTRLVVEPAPLLEAAFSLELLLRRGGGPSFEPWRALATARVRTPLPMLRQLVGPSGLWPAFLCGTEPRLDDAWDRVRSTPRSRLLRPAQYLERQGRLPAWGRSFAAGDQDVLGRIVEEYRGYHAAAIAPVWPTITEHLRADVRRRSAALAEGGVERLLAGLHPDLRWRAPTLSCTLPGAPDGDVELGGRGLRLIPSVFARTPDFLVGVGSPTITYPAEAVLGWQDLPVAPGALADLIGRTRASVLRAIDRHPGSSSTRLGDRLGLSAPAVSKHTAVLRAGHLIVSHRDRQRVVHFVTPLGARLLGEAPA
ncbi:MarR family winged helix-turn-helix transcriptional regulator [Amycolatopsis sp. OK19-0408]|uniref:MarR family winged helix-turn-helix transcriptional regulator n=1 Tax=Amycolatopsis iheyensis TaxID=2945988 RepID=A0A9X2NHM8_9PSEU|nr:MarR family winged helix-turn-helix transcriptional regulator [Amycolatopsis iheyensis]MCR6486767.1 MarR family winged helix-turn-helix transcriptional regulator [Amycolatopsis iheyensis]